MKYLYAPAAGLLLALLQACGGATATTVPELMTELGF